MRVSTRYSLGQSEPPQWRQPNIEAEEAEPTNHSVEAADTRSSPSFRSKTQKIETELFPEHNRSRLNSVTCCQHETHTTPQRPYEPTATSPRTARVRIRRPAEDRTVWLRAKRTISRWAPVMARIPEWVIVMSIFSAESFVAGIIGAISYHTYFGPANNARLKEEVLQSLKAGGTNAPCSCNQSLAPTRIEYRLVNSSGVDHQCLVGDDARMWKRLETALEDTQKQLREMLERSAEQERESLVTSLKTEVESKTEKLRGNVTTLHALVTTLSDMMETKEARMHTELRTLTQRLDELNQLLALEPEVMEIRGFMKIETFGPVLLVLGCVEMIIMLFVCVLISRGNHAHSRE